MIMIDPLKDSIISYLRDIAEIDGEIDPDEKVLIDLLDKQINEYINLLNKSLDDDLLDPIEKVRLFRKKLNILHNFIQKAKEDNVVTAEEKELIAALEQKFNELTKLETEFSIKQNK